MTSNPHQPDHFSSAEGEGRATPAVPVSYSTAWLYFLLVLCLLVAWYFPAKILINRLLWPPISGAHLPRESYSFAALAYEGVSTKPGEVSPARFRDHLETLKERGYVPITLDDVRNLFAKGEPLPARAILLTFDHGRKTSYFGVKSQVRRSGWNGVMFLWTKPIEGGDNASLLWPYVRSMVRSRAWEIGAQSHEGFTPVKANARGRKGRFMTTPMWLEGEGRFETPDEYHARIARDHAKCLNIIEERVGMRPVAYAYPYGDFGQYQTRGTFMRRANLGLVGRHYDLGFVSGNLAANTRYSDPRRLNRLRVRPEWTGEELVAYLDRAWPVEEPAMEGRAADIATAWIVDWGDMRVENNRLALQANDQTTGAKMWLAGSDLTKDFYARIAFRIQQGQMGVYLRATADEESYIYLGLDARGEAWLREKQLGRDAERWPEDVNNEMSIWLRQKAVSLDRFTLASSRTRLDPHADHVLELYLRDRMLYALLDGEPMFGHHIRVRGEPKPGMIGISVWDPGRGRARVDISSVALRNQEPTLASWTERDLYAPYIVQWIHDNSFQLTQISPPWISLSPLGQVTRDQWDADIYRRLASIYHLKLVPRVRIDEEEWLARVPPTQLAEQAGELHLDGVYINLQGIRNPTPTKVGTWLQQCGAALRERGIEFFVQLPALLERPSSVNSLLAVVPHMQVVASTDSALRAATGGARLATVNLKSVPEPESDAELPIYYEIMALPESTEDRTVETRATALEQEGQGAFMEGQYQRAITSWSEWHELEPSNPRPLMLIGDAYLRLNDPQSAIDYYDRSLDRDPGQIALALRRVRVLEDQGKDDEALASLNLYARLFPDNPEVLLAQAEWLRHRGRTDEAVRLIKRAIERQPSNLDAITMMIRITDRSQDRLEYVRQLIAYGQKPENHYELGQVIWKYDLLSMPEAHSLMELVESVHRDTPDERVRLLYDKLRLRSEPVIESFAAGGLSDAWWVTGGDHVVSGQRIRLRADSGRTEVSARLLGSERMRDAYIKATIRDWRGGVWLYGRRSGSQMVRFGFENPDRIHLQIWRDGRVISNQSREWEPVTGAMTLAMEIRGDGVMGYINDKPVFDSPLAIPSELWLGWMGMAAFDARRGAAGVTLDALNAGPIPIRTALLPMSPTVAQVDELLDGLREHARHITDLAPRWFTVRPDGEWIDHIGQEDRLFRLFARYHRMRLMPAVEVLSGTETPVRAMTEQAARHNVDGFVLIMPSMPSDRWFEQMRSQLDLSTLDVFVAVLDSERNIASWRALGAATDLLRVDGKTWPVKMMSGSLKDQAVQDSLKKASHKDPLVLVL